MSCVLAAIMAGASWKARTAFLPKVGCHSDGLILPIAEYPSSSPRCSIIGGMSTVGIECRR